jgi:hypothetical protein
MKYLGEWRLYVNLIMLKNSPKRIGEVIEVTLEYDDSDRSIRFILNWSRPFLKVQWQQPILKN